MKLVIDRKRWLRGEGMTKSFLLRSKDKKMCCMGFWCLANGYGPADIYGMKELAQLEFRDLEFTVGSAEPLNSGPYMETAYAINDSQKITDVEREAFLKRIFKANGVELTFEN